MHIEKIKAIATENLSELIGSTPLGDEDNLYDLGMTSLQAVTLMIALEENFNIRFPHTALNAVSFESVKNINSVIASVLPN
ncbi:phosphopantetheine-binding protein [Serratia rhizosphaerae]|uniref:phosphopantetheine-binding protein n=1 Tax=Serratia sp. Tan611 TaxID=2773264 RepID=UPI0019322DD4|nr:phosphopantetheine-binding protein [Serratia sp. Tan611]CAE1147804.1 Carrier domain-containing protein [Serratia sp. Tan611]